MGREGMDPGEHNTGVEVPIEFEGDKDLFFCAWVKPVVESLRGDETKLSIRVPGGRKFRDGGRPRTHRSRQGSPIEQGCFENCGWNTRGYSYFKSGGHTRRLSLKKTLLQPFSTLPDHRMKPHLQSVLCLDYIGRCD